MALTNGPNLAIVSYIYVLAFHVLNKLALFGSVITAKENAFACGPVANPFWPRRLMVFTLCISAFTVEAMGQTTVVVRRTPSQIVVGADSLVTTRQESTNARERHRIITTQSYACKIVVVQNKAFAYVGWVGGPTAGYVDVNGIGIKSLETTPNIIEAADSFSAMITEPLKKSLEWARLNRIEDYRLSTIDAGTGGTKTSLAAFFLAVENGIPTLAHRGFKVINAESEPVQLVPVNDNCPSEACPHNFDVTGMAGHYDEIKEYKTNKPFWRENGNVGGVRLLIEKMEQSSELVGGPIDILRITKDGACWVQHKKDCNADVPECQTPKPARRK